MALDRVVSGAQTGVDQAALDVALELGISCGGWVPLGRINELGRIPAHYPNLRETESADFSARTAANVRDSDGTLIISRGALTGGSLYTRQVAEESGRPCLHVDLGEQTLDGAVTASLTWLDQNEVGVLNVAGPRASKDPEIHGLASSLLRHMLA